MENLSKIPITRSEFGFNLPWYGALLVVLCCLFGLQAPAQDFSGHLKFRLTYSGYPADSHYRDLTGASTEDLALDSRFNLGWQVGNWDIKTSVQAIALHADTLRLTRSAPEDLANAGSGVPGDDRRLFDLTHTVYGRGKHAGVVRVDRLSVGYISSRGVVRVGRQAITWGNGLIFNNVMDLFNPFDPAAVDREYKPGDDMIYGQYLRDNGDDLQAVIVFRRDPTNGKFDADQASLALKYHGFTETGEYDLLLARHYGDIVIGAGGNRGVLGDTLLRGDITATFTDDHRIVPSVVASLGKSFVMGGKNVSGAIEYYHNGFGQGGKTILLEDLQLNHHLQKRIARGEIFNTGRHYLGMNAAIEVTPLFILTPAALINLEDRSALLQLAASADIGEESLLKGTLNVPTGPAGSEFGGLRHRSSGLPLARGTSIDLQFATYF